MTDTRASRQERGSVPTLTIERDILPTVCTTCGSQQLDRTPQMAGQLGGQIDCGMCGTVLCYVRAAFRARPGGRL